MKSIVRIDMSSLAATTETIPGNERLLGGRGLITRILSDEVNPRTHPLAKDNKVIIAPGVFADTTIPCSSRLSIGTKSPLTGRIKESNVGGPAAQLLGSFGIAAIIIEGAHSDSFSVLKIDDGETVTFEAAGDLAGMGNYQAVETLRERYGTDIVALTIGPAGEMLLPASTVAATDQDGYPSRHAGRGGIGAVLGSKGIKAIVVRNKPGKKATPLDKQLMTESLRDFSEMVLKINKANKRYGTPWLINFINKANALPTRNFSRGHFEGAEKISGERITELIHERGGMTGHSCYRGCIIHCSHVFNDRDGNYVTSGPEYETVGMLGSNLEIDDIDQIALMDRLCSDIGVDTIEMGATLGVLMESNYLAFGNGTGCIDLLEEIRKGSPMGRLAGSGCETVGKIFGCSRVPVVKGQGMPSYDPRALQGMGVTIATSPMGADHTAGPIFPGMGKLDAAKPEGQVALSRSTQTNCAILDNFGLCLYTSPSPKTMDFITRAVKALYGMDLTVEELADLGTSILDKEYSFNEKTGIDAGTDDLPLFFRNEPLPETETAFAVPQEELQSIRKSIHKT